jgi:hypothetical protein
MEILKYVLTCLAMWGGFLLLWSLIIILNWLHAFDEEIFT